MTRKEHARFDVLNSIHPSEQAPKEKYEFYLLLGKSYLGKSSRKTKNIRKPKRNFIEIRENMP